MDVNMIIPENCHEVFVPVSAGIIVSLLNPFILNNPNFTMCSDTNYNQTVEKQKLKERWKEKKAVTVEAYLQL